MIRPLDTAVRYPRPELGMSLRTWRRRLRPFKAIELLGGGLGVTQTAMELGYGSTSALCMRFVAKWGAAHRHTCADVWQTGLSARYPLLIIGRDMATLMMACSVNADCEAIVAFCRQRSALWSEL